MLVKHRTNSYLVAKYVERLLDSGDAPSGGSNS